MRSPGTLHQPHPSRSPDSDDLNPRQCNHDYLCFLRATRVGKALSEAEDLLSCYVDLPENEAKQKFVSAFRKQ